MESCHFECGTAFCWREKKTKDKPMQRVTEKKERRRRRRRKKNVTNTFKPIRIANDVINGIDNVNILFFLLCFWFQSFYCCAIWSGCIHTYTEWERHVLSHVCYQCVRHLNNFVQFTLVGESMCVCVFIPHDRLTIRASGCVHFRHFG